MVGSHEQIADFIEDWFGGAAADGFVLADSGIPGQFALFVEQVVPQLRKRGPAGPHRAAPSHRGATLRSHLGLAVPDRVGRPA